jgi:hypothetical protein
MLRSRSAGAAPIVAAAALLLLGCCRRGLAVAGAYTAAFDVKPESAAVFLSVITDALT